MVGSKQLLVEQAMSRKTLTNRNIHQELAPSTHSIHLSLNKNVYYLVNQKNFSSGAELIKYLQLEQYIDNALSRNRGG